MFETETAGAIAEYSPIAAALAGVEKYRGLVCDVSTPHGMAEAKAAHKEVAALRIALDKTRKRVKEDVLARGRLIDSEAKVIFEKIAAIEDPIKAQIDAEERKVEEARLAAVKAESDRIAKEEAERKAVEERRLAEERAKNEAEARRLAEERVKLEAEQRAAREKVEAEERVRREAIAAEEAAAKKRIADAEAAARAQRQAEEDKIRAERIKLEDEQRLKAEAARAERLAQEALERAEREAKEAEERKARLAEQERLDAYATLSLFLRQAGDRVEFAIISREVRMFLETVERAA